MQTSNVTVHPGLRLALVLSITLYVAIAVAIGAWYELSVFVVPAFVAGYSLGRSRA